jgi:hypothetical protein
MIEYKQHSGVASTPGNFGGVIVVDDAGRTIEQYTAEGWQQKLLNDRLKAIEEKLDRLLEIAHG